MGEVSEVIGRVAEKEYIRNVIAHFLGEGKSVSLWRLPDSEEKNLIISQSLLKVDPEQLTLEDSAPGFLISPFHRKSPRWFMPDDIRIKIKAGEVQYLKGVEPKELRISTRPAFHQRSSTAPSSTYPDAFQNIVQKGVDAIQRGELEKIVPSRKQEFELPEQTDFLELFEKLCARNPQAMVTLVSSPETGTWMGASPELLVQVRDGSIFRTTALASTQVYREGMDLKSVTWNQKEIEEQALVSRYIINNCFKKIRLREYEEYGPKTFRAGNLLHLKTDFSVDMVAINFPQLGSVMLRLLHPTSAVCGMPADAALSFLESNEGYDRELYTGYWGPVNIDGDTNLYVNLRCMKLEDSKATLYAGAGVTNDSVPALEWEETVNKMNTLRQVIVNR